MPNIKTNYNKDDWKYMDVNRVGERWTEYRDLGWKEELKHEKILKVKLPQDFYQIVTYPDGTVKEALAPGTIVDTLYDKLPHDGVVECLLSKSSYQKIKKRVLRPGDTLYVLVREYKMVNYSS